MLCQQNRLASARAFPAQALETRPSHGWTALAARVSHGLVLLAIALGGCAGIMGPGERPVEDAVPPYDELLAQVEDPQVDLAALRRAFLARDDFDERLKTLLDLEAQVLATLDQRPLRLGAVGSAIVDVYHGSLTGHLALAKFYDHVDAPDRAAYHERWVARIRQDIALSGDGSRTNPYPVLLASQARAFLTADGLATMGAAYEQSQTRPFMLWLAARPEDGTIQHVRFDLGQTYQAFEQAVLDDPETVLPVPGPPLTCAAMRMCESFNTYAFVHLLGRGQDSAAQVLIGRTLAGMGNRFDDATEWLRQAARADNAIANAALGELYLAVAYRTAQSSARVWFDRAERHLLLAISAGFDNAMVQLGGLYLVGRYGQDKIETGLTLLREAADLSNVDALVALADLHAAGSFVARNLDAAEAYYLRAAELDDDAKIAYARFLIQPTYERTFNDRAFEWVQAASAQDNAQGMLLLAQLHHTGTYVPQNSRQARTWFKRAVKVAPDDAFVVNQAAWTLTVTQLRKLRDPRFALKAMDRVMADEESAARKTPAYLDTWAATYAANGDFERAIAIQQEAITIEQAHPDREQRDTLPILLDHLSAFRAGERISDEAIP